MNLLLMFELELKQPTSKDKDEKWACGYFPKRVWYKSVEDERLLVKFNNCDAAFMSSLMVNLSSDVIMTNKTSFRLCSSACLEDHRCSAVSYNGEDGNCVFALNAFKFHRDGRAVMDFWNWNLLQFQRDGFKLLQQRHLLEAENVASSHHASGIPKPIIHGARGANSRRITSKLLTLKILIPLFPL